MRTEVQITEKLQTGRVPKLAVPTETDGTKTIQLVQILISRYIIFTTEAIQGVRLKWDLKPIISKNLVASNIRIMVAEVCRCAFLLDL